MYYIFFFPLIIWQPLRFILWPVGEAGPLGCEPNFSEMLLEHEHIRGNNDVKYQSQADESSTAVVSSQTSTCHTPVMPSPPLTGFVVKGRPLVEM